MYTDALTYAYIDQPHRPTSVAPFELVLSKPPGPIKLKALPSREEPKGGFKRKWKSWLHERMEKTKKRLGNGQNRYRKK